VERKSVTIKLRGGYILPGLIEAHVHLSGSGEADSQYNAPGLGITEAGDGFPSRLIGAAFANDRCRVSS
jgi:imidazolonepropionase-like amidohydrolase